MGKTKVRGANRVLSDSSQNTQFQDVQSGRGSRRRTRSVHLSTELELGGGHPRADPEEVTVRDEENPEFKLPKMNSLLLVLMTNVLMQVISRFLPTQWISYSLSPKTPDLFFHHCSLFERVRGTVGRRRDVLRACHRYPDAYLSLGPRATLEVRQRC